MRQKLHSVTQSLRLPSICTLCNQFHKGKFAVCHACILLMPELENTCQYCAYPLFDADYLVCGHCIKERPDFDRSFVRYAFEEPLRSLLHRFKYYDGLYLGSFLAHLILNAVIDEPHMPECLIPVPMHPQRMKLRGFNQAAVLSKLLAKQLAIPVDVHACKKISNTLPQASLDREERQLNLRDAFYCKQLPYQHVALVDDLITTGATVNEVALSLKTAGVQQVDIWCCARTISKSSTYEF